MPNQKVKYIHSKIWTANYTSYILKSKELTIFTQSKSSLSGCWTFNIFQLVSF